MVEDLGKLDWKLGEQYDWWVVSIDLKEGPNVAGPKKEAYLKALFGMNQNESWESKPADLQARAEKARAHFHFLTGSLTNQSQSITELTKLAGFRYKWVEAENQYAHPAVAMMLTPEGKMSRYLYGIRFDQKDLKLAMNEAGQGKVGTLVERFLLFCYSYDAVRKGYTIAIWRLVQVASAVMIICFSGFIFLVVRREREWGIRT